MCCLIHIVYRKESFSQKYLKWNLGRVSNIVLLASKALDYRTAFEKCIKNSVVPGSCYSIYYLSILYRERKRKMRVKE